MSGDSDRFVFDSAGRSDTGRVRNHNEDSFLELPPAGVWVVADGMGGHHAGDIASRIICEEIGSVGVPVSAQDQRARVTERLERAHQRILSHSEVQELLAAGSISEDEARVWPRKNVITRAIGIHERPNTETVTGVVQPDDLFLLCSDGLTEHLSDAELTQALSGSRSADVIADALVAETLVRGARDNVTVIVLRCMARDDDPGFDG